MSTSSVEFPLSPVKRRLGILPEPIIPLGIKTTAGTKLFDFLVDSGADLTLLPHGVAEELGIDLRKCRSSITLGVEGRGIKIYHSTISLEIGPWTDRIRCAFALHDLIPPLLGRLDIFTRYNVTFHAKRNSIIFRRV